MPQQERLSNKDSINNIFNWPHVRTNPDLLLSIVASKKAGRILTNGFFKEFKTFVKEDNSDFTPYDVQVELLVKAIIREHEPNAIIMGEELSPDEDISGKNFWVIDGIDGTTNFSRGIPICNFTMAKIENGQTKVGIVMNFLWDELFYAVKNGGAFRKGRPIHVSDRSFDENLISFAPLLDVRKGKGENEAALVNATWAGMRDIAQDSGRFQREFQSGGLELAWVASGVTDGFASSWTSPWDLSAGVLLVKEAGGRATNILGEDWSPSFWGVIAGNQHVHPHMLKHIQKHYR